MRKYFVSPNGQCRASLLEVVGDVAIMLNEELVDGLWVEVGTENLRADRVLQALEEMNEGMVEMNETGVPKANQRYSAVFKAIRTLKEVRNAYQEHTEAWKHTDNAIEQLECALKAILEVNQNK
jgi:hypothetical protein